MAGTDGETLPGMTWLSVPDVAREANVDETSSDASSTWGAVGEDEGLLGDRDVGACGCCTRGSEPGSARTSSCAPSRRGALARFLDTPMMAGAGSADRT